MAKAAFGHKRIFRTGIAVAVFAAAFLLQPVTVAAQPCTTPDCELGATPSEHITLLSLNALIGGVTAGILRIAHGDPVKQALADGFLRGAVGGGLSYTGKRVAASDFDGAGTIGREIAAFGASTTANAADGIGTFDRLMFPLGPFPVRLALTKNGSGRTVRPLIDLLSAAGVVYGLAASRYSFDWGASFSGGVAVFRERSPQLDEFGVLDVDRASGDEWTYHQDGHRVTVFTGATTVGGAVFASYLAPDDRILAHERVHALQFDFVAATLSDRADTWTMAKLPSVDRWLKLNLVPMAFGAFNQSVMSLSNHDSFPWEREAILLSGHR
jgi:hypothetical protein